MDKIVVFGSGRESTRFIDVWQHEIPIEYILDNYCADNDTQFMGYPVKRPDTDSVLGKKIIITPGYYYANIKTQLEGYGLKEREDFWSINDFLAYAERNGLIPERETKRIAFVGFNTNFDIYNNELINTVSMKYNVVIDYEDPQYVFCSVFGTPYEYLKYKGIRIYYSGETTTPDFNLVDYGISYNRDLKYEDRFFRELPFFGRKVGGKKIKSISEKTDFCNFVYGHERVDQLRRGFFEALSKYKRVDSLGSLLNNMPDGFYVTRMNKIAQTRKYKFSIAFESVDMSGFISEKISDAFDAGTIPIYMGDPHVSEIFNKEAYIDVHDYVDFDEVIEKIKELDNDDEKYLDMVNQPVFNPSFDNMSKLQEMQRFILNIFDQDYEKAFRRGLDYSEYYNGSLNQMEEQLLYLNKMMHTDH